MSASVLCENVRKQLREQIDEHAGYCAQRTSDTLDQVRLNQGKVAGLSLALDILDQAYRDLNG
jgi:hypothetical protein